jgi:hypothetical protein
MKNQTHWGWNTIAFALVALLYFAFIIVAIIVGLTSY